MIATRLPAMAAWCALASILLLQPSQMLAADAAPTRFAIRSLQTQPAPAESGSGRFAAIAAAQLELAPALQRRFSVKTAVECSASPGDVLLRDGFETP